jgi:hypothetical protein
MNMVRLSLVPGSMIYHIVEVKIIIRIEACTVSVQSYCFLVLPSVDSQ